MSARPGFAWDLRETEGVSVVTLNGFIDEEADFSSLRAELQGRPRIRLDLAGIERINSVGTREWINFIGQLAGELELENCAPVVVAQLNMIRNFAGAGRVRSVKAPYVCEDCGQETELVIDVRGGVPPPPKAPTCTSCGSTMEFDDLADVYFAFLGSDRGLAR